MTILDAEPLRSAFAAVAPGTLLEALDTDSPTGRIYTALVAHPLTTTARIASTVAIAEPEVLQVLEKLANQGLVSRRDTTAPAVWEAELPEHTLTATIDAEEQRLRAARIAREKLSRLHWVARREAGRYPGLEVLRDPSQVIAEIWRMIHMAEHEVWSLNRPPFFTGTDSEMVDTQVAWQSESMRAGVEFKSVWWDGLFDDPIVSRGALAQMAAGEQSRILANLPMKLIIADDRQAMLPLDPNDLTDGATLVIHPSGLLDALRCVFDTLWNLATPISDAGKAPDLTDQERAILSLMFAGATDDAIARRLRLSRRTVARHAADLFDRLGAKTRFQAGAQAVRRGWL